MVAATATDIVRTADGIPLKVKLRRVDRVRKVKGARPGPAAVPVHLVSFVMPIVVMLFNAVSDPEIAANMPQTIAALERWNGDDLPDETAFAALAADLKAARRTEDHRARSASGSTTRYRASAARS